MFGIKKWLRRPVPAVLWLLVLTAACAVMCLGVFAYISAADTADELESQFVTIAVLKAQWTRGEYQEIEVDGTSGEDSDSVTIGEMGQGRIHAFDEDEFANDRNILVSDFRRYQTAYSPGITPLLSAMTEKAYQVEYDEPYGAVMLRVTVQSHTYEEYHLPALPALGIDEQNSYTLRAVVRIDEVILAHEGYELPETIDIVYTESEPLIEVEDGKSYIVFGYYHASHLIWDEFLHQTGQEQRNLPPSIGISTGLPKSFKILNDDGVPEEVDLAEFDDIRTPTIAPIEGDTEDFLSDPVNELWTRTVERYRITLSSLPMLGTDCIESMLPINQKSVTLAEGRYFSEEEYASGANVCVISDALAAYNGLSVGDTISLRPYLFDNSTPSGQVAWQNVSGTNPKALVYNPTVGFGAEAREFTIVGLYHTDDAWPEPNNKGSFDFSPNTVFIPKAAVLGDYYTSDNGALYSLRIRNGCGDAFLVSLKGTELENAFAVYDQGYSEVAQVLAEMQSNALTLFILGLAAFTAVALLYVLLHIGGERRMYGTMRSLGQTQRSVLGVAIGGNLLPLAIVLPAAGIVSYALLDVVRERVLGGYGSGLAWIIPVVLVAEALLITVFVAVYCSLAVRTNPLKLMKEDK